MGILPVIRVENNMRLPVLVRIVTAAVGTMNQRVHRKQHHLLRWMTETRIIAIMKTRKSRALTCIAQG